MCEEKRCQIIDGEPELMTGHAFLASGAARPRAKAGIVDKDTKRIMLGAYFLGQLRTAAREVKSAL